MSQSEATANGRANQLRRCSGEIAGVTEADSAKTAALGPAQLRPLARLIASSILCISQDEE